MCVVEYSLYRAHRKMKQVNGDVFSALFFCVEPSTISLILFTFTVSRLIEFLVAAGRYISFCGGGKAFNTQKKKRTANPEEAFELSEWSAQLLVELGRMFHTNLLFWFVISLFFKAATLLATLCSREKLGLFFSFFFLFFLYWGDHRERELNTDNIYGRMLETNWKIFARGDRMLCGGKMLAHGKWSFRSVSRRKLVRVSLFVARVSLRHVVLGSFSFFSMSTTATVWGATDGRRRVHGVCDGGPRSSLSVWKTRIRGVLFLYIAQKVFHHREAHREWKSCYCSARRICSFPVSSYIVSNENIVTLATVVAATCWFESESF